LTLSGTAPENKTCNFDLVFDGKQIGGVGFSDTESLSNNVTSGTWQTCQTWTTKADFDASASTFNNVVTTDNAGGEVQLSSSKTDYGITSTGTPAPTQQGYAKATKVTLSNSTNISSLSFYSHATGNARLAIYDNAVNYRKSHIINHSSNASTGYQVRIVAHKGSGSDSGINVYLGNNVRDDFGDVRFTASDGSTPLNYWMETGSLISGSQAAFWVKVEDDLSSTNRTIYIYYGGNNVTTTSNGANTFVMFDDFDGSSLGSNWTRINGSSPAFTDGLMTVSAGTDPSKIIATGATQSNNFAIGARFKMTGGADSDERAGLGVKTSNSYNSDSRYSYGTGYNYVFRDFFATDETRFLDDSIAWDETDNYGSWSKNSFYTMEVFYDGSRVRGRTNFGTWNAQSWNNRTTGYLALNIGSRDAITVWDWAFVRKCIATEPSHGSWGAQETVGSAPYTKLWESNDILITTAGWKTVNMGAGTPTSLTLSAGTYWLAWQWDSANAGPSYTAGSSGDGNYIVQSYGAFPSTWSGGSSTNEKWSIYASNITYASTGNLESSSFNAGQIASWQSLEWNEGTLPSGTDITLEAAISNNGSTWSAWQLSSGSTPIDLTSLTQTQYIKWKATLNSDTSKTPELQEVRVCYALTGQNIWKQTTQAHFELGTLDKVDTSSSPGDVKLSKTAGSGSIILRPNQNVDPTALSKSGSGGSNYDRVDDDPSSDGDSTYVYSTASGEAHDIYNLPDPFLTGTINSVTVHSRMRQVADSVSTSPSGPNNAGTGTDVSGIGTYTWSNPGNIIAVGSPYSETATLGTGGTSHYLQGTNYGFDIPTNATIIGIQVVINRFAPTTLGVGVRDQAVYLVKNISGSPVIQTAGDNKATGTTWPTSLNTANYGSASDLWGLSWTPSDINNVNFGVALSAHNNGSWTTRKATVDYMQITVSYTTSAPVSGRTYIKTNGVEYAGDWNSLTTSYADYSKTYTTNPQTSSLWTWAEVNALQAGVSFKNATGEARATQVWAEVNYTSSPFNTSGTLESQSFDGGEMADWQSLEWDETTPAGTDITFEVATSNDGSTWSGWSLTSGTSPINLTTLLETRYIKWRATLTTSDTSQTPILHEVRVIHYPGAASEHIVLNEFLPNPSGTNPDYGFDFGEDNDLQPKGEWVEIYNKTGGKAVDLAGWYIQDQEGNIVNITSSNTSDGSTVISSEGWLVVYLNMEMLNNDGDTVYLYDMFDNLIDSHSYDLSSYCTLEPTPEETNDGGTPALICPTEVPGNKSYARIPDGTGAWFDPIPTPGEQNKLEEIIPEEELTDTEATTTEATTTEATTTEVVSTTTEEISTTTENNQEGEGIIEQIDEAIDGIIDGIFEEIIPDEATNEEPATEEIPAVDETSVIEEIPNTEETVIEETPVTEEQPIIEENAPVIEEQPVTTPENTAIESVAPEAGGGDGAAGGEAEAVSE
jgi:hypothetical protein